MCPSSLPWDTKGTRCWDHVLVRNTSTSWDPCWDLQGLHVDPPASRGLDGLSSMQFRKILRDRPSWKTCPGDFPRVPWPRTPALYMRVSFLHVSKLVLPYKHAVTSKQGESRAAGPCPIRTPLALKALLPLSLPHGSHTSTSSGTCAPPSLGALFQGPGIWDQLPE